MADTAPHPDMASLAYFDHSSAKRINTDAVLVEALRTQYPHLDLVVAPQQGLNLLAYASAGFAKATPLDDTVKDPVYGPGLSWRMYMPPARRLDDRPGTMTEKRLFGKFAYKWKEQEAILYVADGRDGGSYYPSIINHYILTNATHKVDELIKDATTWGLELHRQIWVFDGGQWQKSAELYQSVQNSSWDQVILDDAMKRALIADVETFFDSQQTYADLHVPWKRGIIYHGPPGNGKTISIKATMHLLSRRGTGTDHRRPIPTLYVRSLSSFAGPEYAIGQIFTKARHHAPCYLIFEDLDSLITPATRSYFLNEIDGLRPNDGILLLGSTNHLDRLDPGLARRPSRFDRKYFFPNPHLAQREQYARFWQHKLRDNPRLAFPDPLCARIADITFDFSFAYMQEAFVAALLAIAARGGEARAPGWGDGKGGEKDDRREEKEMDKEKGDKDKDLDKLPLWIEMQKQVDILRQDMDQTKRGT